ncbi:hypothetical protein JOB18_035275 [Solea senegalensis]|uniref:Uncharacterized protein n=1 Tax=Solea senegalensis TaxID=28829 RepID=A0AAV6PSH6_SOLSE|nr:hypothetical protein JOB18_035275 [Solea senegalensis]
MVITSSSVEDKTVPSCRMVQSEPWITSALLRKNKKNTIGTSLVDADVLLHLPSRLKWGGGFVVGFPHLLTGTCKFELGYLISLNASLSYDPLCIFQQVLLLTEEHK